MDRLRNALDLPLDPDAVFDDNTHDFILMYWEILKNFKKNSLEISTKFFSHELFHLLTCHCATPIHQVVYSWTPISTRRSLLQSLQMNVIHEFPKILTATQILEISAKTLKRDEIRWNFFLPFLVFSQDSLGDDLGHQYVSLLTPMLETAFEELNEKTLTVVFMVSHVLLAADPNSCSQYSFWFQTNIVNEKNKLAPKKKKVLQFLLKVLTNLIPWESPQCLKIHIQNLGQISKVKDFVSDYVLLAKQRLRELGQPFNLEDPMGNSGATTTAIASNSDLAVRSAIEKFIKTNRIPESVTNMKTFQSTTFTKSFLPALLTPRIPVQDPREKFILQMLSDRCISQDMYDNYVESCRRMSHVKQVQVESGFQLENFKSQVKSFVEADEERTIDAIKSLGVTCSIFQVENPENSKEISLRIPANTLFFRIRRKSIAKLESKFGDPMGPEIRRIQLEKFKFQVENGNHERRRSSNFTFRKSEFSKLSNRICSSGNFSFPGNGGISGKFQLEKSSHWELLGTRRGSFISDSQLCTCRFQSFRGNWKFGGNFRIFGKFAEFPENRKNSIFHGPNFILVRLSP
eukprot:TRINITY_DN4767_c0_g1_i4.p1 TRINITY_DN4767_c0_g1~~TRINITY_DN4767_c0_g1_i4.p1  ORF type:complete len:598 (+),score=247.95 TRINITY_DN4767_c0_g1_i4:72-1796(+)